MGQINAVVTKISAWDECDGGKLIEGGSISDEVQSNSIVVPYVVQMFATIDEAKAAYTLNTGSIGFNICMASTKIVDDILVGRRMLCSNEGYQMLMSKCMSPKRQNACNVLEMFIAIA